MFLWTHEICDCYSIRNLDLIGGKEFLSPNQAKVMVVVLSGASNENDTSQRNGNLARRYLVQL